MSLLLSNDGHERKVARSNPGSHTPTAPQLKTCLTAVGSATPQALVAFSHAALFSPALSTLTTALVKGFLPPMPGLTLATLCKYPPKSVATIKGPLDQIHKNLCSTKTLKPSTAPDPADEPDDLSEAFPSSHDGNLATHYCYAAVISPQSTGQVHSDQTDKFLVASSIDNNYLLIVYDYDSNGILAKPMPR
jgi:membrane-associated phospholipid phosphatase